MRTIDVKVNQVYFYGDQEVIVKARIFGKETKQCQMQNGEVFVGHKRQQKKFLLDIGDMVFAHQLHRRS